MPTAACIERALFVIGDQNTGKSVQLRSMFIDQRLGRGGVVPEARNLQNAYALSNERRLYLRLTSPHEAGESIEAFLDKCAYEMQPGDGNAWRWNIAAALQPTAGPKIAAAPDIVRAFAARFSPERTRAAIVTPDWQGTWIAQATLRTLIDAFRNIPRTEVIMIDATDRTANGLVLADFFDFT